jgi:hypothetical protein
MDLNSLKPNERVVEIVHPRTKEPLGVSVTLLSLIDEKLTKLKRRLADNNLANQRRGKMLTAAQAEDNEDIILFEAMTTWEWKEDNTFRGEKPAFNLTKVKEVFQELPWFKNQLREAIEDEEAFF